MTVSTVTIDRALTDSDLLGAALGPADSWATWLTVLRAAFGVTLDRRDRRAFEAVAGGRKAPAQRVKELWAIAGRRAGKSRLAAAIAVFIATLVDHSAKLVAGEVGYVLVLAPTEKQARLVFGYALAFLQGSPVLAGLVEGTTSNEIRLAGGIVIATHPSSFRSVRGRTLIACIFDECSFWRDEASANPDQEVYIAVLPALATTDGMLIGISSAYRRLGLLFAKFRDHFGHDDDNVLVVRGSTELFNPKIDRRIIEAARMADPAAAAAEWDSEFRSDLQQFLDDDLIDGAVDYARPLELPPRENITYRAFVDASAGRHDAFCVAVGHVEDGRFVADCVRGRRPPFDPAAVARENASLALEYRCREVTGDNYSGEWVSAAFEAAGVKYERSAKPKSALYLEALPWFTRGAVSIPDMSQLIRELRLLERRVSRSGKDSVDHGSGGSDDYANVLCGAIATLAENRSTYSLEALVGDTDDDNEAWRRNRLWSHILSH